jgi:microcystin-dependent protein
VLAQTGGTETVVLTQAELPIHNHSLMASSLPSTSTTPANNLLAVSVNSNDGTNADAHYVSAAGTVVETLALNEDAILSTGTNPPHQNIMPSFCVKFIIALMGVYPQPS